MGEVVFWGAAGQARVLLETLRGTDMRLVALIDNRDIGPEFLGVPVLHGEAGLDSWLKTRRSQAKVHCCVAIGGARGNDRLMLLDSMKQRGLKPLTLVHRTAFLADSATLGDGCQVLAQSAVCADAKLGLCVIVNTAASVDHECVIGDGVHIAPGARLAGEVRVHDRAFVGIGAVILPRIEIGADAVVGAGAIVTKNVPAGATVAGNPARVLTKN